MGKVLQSGDGAAALETQARRLSLSDGPGDKVGIPEEDETIITVVVRALDSILQKGMQLLAAGKKEEVVTIFHTKVDPNVTMAFYLKRMFVYGKLSPCCFLVALILMDRLAHHLKGIIVSNFNVHRMYVTCVLISTKYLDDIFFSNAHWAKIAGLSVAEMNALEMDVLFMLDWNVHVRPEEYMRYRSSIMALIPDATRAGVQVDIVPVAERSK